MVVPIIFPTSSNLFEGSIDSSPSLPEARAKILANEEAILDVIRNDEMLAKNFKNKTVKFLGKYFDMLRDDDDFEKQVVRKCRK